MLSGGVFSSLVEGPGEFHLQYPQKKRGRKSEKEERKYLCEKYETA